MNPFSDFAKEIENLIGENQVDKFVLDVRDNGGGNEGVIRPLEFLLSSQLNEYGKLFIIIGRHTFSSALANAIDFKEYSKSILVGEPTGGKPNAYGEVRNFTLPNNYITVYYSTRFWQRMHEDPETLLPDYQVEISSEDFIDGFDPVLDYVLKYQ